MGIGNAGTDRDARVDIARLGIDGQIHRIGH